MSMITGILAIFCPNLFGYYQISYYYLLLMLLMWERLFTFEL